MTSTRTARPPVIFPCRDVQIPAESRQYRQHTHTHPPAKKMHRYLLVGKQRKILGKNMYITITLGIEMILQ